MSTLITPERIRLAREKAVKSKKPSWMSDDTGMRGVGRLEARIMPNGVCHFYFRCSVLKKRTTEPLGTYSRVRKSGFLTISEARSAAANAAQRVMAQLSLPASRSQSFPSSRHTAYEAAHRTQATSDSASYGVRPMMAPVAGVGPVVTEVGHEAPASDLSESAEAAGARLPTVVDVSLKGLCLRYLTFLRAKGSTLSAREYERLFDRFIYGTPFASRPASDFQTTDFVDVLRTVLADSGEKTSRTLRSAMHAAYNMVKKTGNDARLPKGLEPFRITHNPISDATKIGTDKPRKRCLEDSELYAFLLLLRRGGKTCQNLAIRLLRVDLLLGGQRGIQLARAELKDVASLKSITIRDNKGRREEPREHELPLTPKTFDEIEWLRSRASSRGSKFLFASESDAGKHLSSSTISRWGTAISRFLILKNKSKAPFQFRDIRRTVESTLSRLKVDDKVLAHLLSHGLTGVQHKFYNMHPFFDEKRAALIVWQEHLDSLDLIFANTPDFADPGWMDNFETWATAKVSSKHRSTQRRAKLADTRE